MTTSRTTQLFKQLFLFSALLIASSYIMQGQDATGRVVGTITDRSGAVIPNAHVVVTNADTHVARETVTNSSGFYQVLSLPIGNYMVSADHKG
ncbi:MAG: carboxypeptidase-like regulatory domain-containing protein, partial [Candidatus Angelobacter sp.]